MKILIIEDDSFFRNFYATKLKEKGYQIDMAEDGEVALQKITSFQPDLILLDIILPKVDGFEILQAMKNDSKISFIPVIVFSTLGQEADVKKALSLGVKDYINKSYFDFEKMLQKIIAYLPKT